MNSSPPQLKRHLNTLTLSFYGIGVIVGAGIYVLVGKLAAVSGNAIWLAFLVSALAALPTGLSYAELASRYPKSAGEAVFADRAFRNRALSFLVGFLILASGIASTAALSHGFAAYFSEFIDLPTPLTATMFIGALVFLNYLGIKEATWVNIVCTVVSVGALILIAVFGVIYWQGVDYWDLGAAIQGDSSVTALILSGAALAFYAYIGFEDIVNVAEEVKSPERTIPRAILLSLGISALIYVSVGLTVVAVVPADQLARSEVPLATVAEVLFPKFPSHWLSAIALFAVFNSALLNMVMASRILYGMSSSGWIPKQFSRIHPKRHTPVWGVVLAGFMALLFSLSGLLQVLAESTNVIILMAFFLVNLSLIVIRARRTPPDRARYKHFRVPIFVPVLGVLSTSYFVAQFSAGAYLRAFAILVIGLLLYVFQGR